MAKKPKANLMNTKPHYVCWVTDSGSKHILHTAKDKKNAEEFKRNYPALNEGSLIIEPVKE